MAAGVMLRNRCRTDPDSPEGTARLNADAQKWFDDAGHYIEQNMSKASLTQFRADRPTAFSPGGVPEARTGLWLGIHQRVEILDKFIDRLANLGVKGL